MKSLKLAAVIVVVGTMLFIPKAFADSLSDSNGLFVTQAKTELKPQLKIPTIEPLSKLNSSPNARDVHTLLNQISQDLKKGNFQKGLEGCNTVLKLDENNFLAHLFRGFAYSHLQQSETAIADFEKAIRINPSSAYPYFGRGIALIQLEKYRESITDLEQTIKIKPELAHAYFWRGIAKANLAQTDEAKSDLQKAAELYQKQGDSEDAELALNVLKEIHLA